MKRLLLFLFCLGLAGSLQAGTLGKGSAEIFEGNEGAARDQAKQNALRDAVEQGVGTLIDSKTKVENWQVISDEVFTSSQGFVKSFKMLADEKRGSSWWVEIDAEVATDLIKGKLSELRILHKKMGNKRLLVIYRAESPQALEEDNAAVSTCLGQLQTDLTAAGFRVFDQKSIERVSSQRRTQETWKLEKWMQIAQEQQADILAEFELSANTGSRGAAMIQSAEVALQLRVYDVSTGRLIASQSAQQRQMTNAHPGSFDWRQAQAGASTKAASMAASDSVTKIVEYYKSVGDVGQAFWIRFTGFSQDEEDQMLAILENLEGYQSLSELKNDPQSIEIEYFSNLQKSQLRRKLQAEANMKGIKLKSQEISGERFDFVRQQ
ncbi:MAG: hypothetical protein A2527_08585 [Candidatus Lambdaproteobacteria bacterium RIFOXYD2_FULL_50_16]|uniref:Flagellar assembly protein T N-terminal domain-containing protein n=1 Tax=Candidatus Lambdaproteobacteria bacterium RIFOXYD2_FULL_50_16 TaxID=1817772 RepID=A0A1F6GAX0_9PROT|nr:MAG: hypothetical protein A2527_08585 [Candidatus Lambdaproteobacteria bacterium RIFOXYD2_FULL_50_16]